MFNTDFIDNFWSSGLWNAIKYTGLGMLGIFIVTGLIIAVIYALAYFTNREPKTTDESQD
jgi:hypothetical protein